MGDIFTEKDWDEFMEKHPDLKREHMAWLWFIKNNPELAYEIDKAILEIINKGNG